MSTIRIPRHSLQRTLPSSCANRLQRCRVAQLQSRRWYAEEKEEAKEEKKGFHGQLYNSVYERVQRERADEERFANHRARMRAEQISPMWFVPFGE